MICFFYVSVFVDVFNPFHKQNFSILSPRQHSDKHRMFDAFFDYYIPIAFTIASTNEWTHFEDSEWPIDDDYWNDQFKRNFFLARLHWLCPRLAFLEMNSPFREARQVERILKRLKRQTGDSTKSRRWGLEVN